MELILLGIKQTNKKLSYIEKSIEVDTNSVLQQYYKAVVFKDNETFTANVYVKIDKINPGFYNDDKITEDGLLKNNICVEDGYITKGIYKAKTYDNESGIDKYAISNADNGISNCSDGTLQYKKDGSLYIKQPGKYYVCVKDKAGNYSLSSKLIEFKCVDGTKESDIKAKINTIPESPNGENGWFIGNNITLNLNSLSNNGASGLKFTLAETNNKLFNNADSISSIYLKGNDNLVFSHTITKSFESTINGKICTGAKVCSETNKDIKYENGIGLMNISLSKKYNSVTATISEPSNVSKIASYHYYLYKSDGTLIKDISSTNKSYKFTGLENKSNSISYYVRVVAKSNAGNTTEVTSSSITVPAYCSKTVAEVGDWGGCSKTCGGGVQTRSVTYKSYYNNSLKCSEPAAGETATSTSRRCNEQSCGEKYDFSMHCEANNATAVNTCTKIINWSHYLNEYSSITSNISVTGNRHAVTCGFYTIGENDGAYYLDRGTVTYYRNSFNERILFSEAPRMKEIALSCSAGGNGDTDSYDVYGNITFNR